MERVSVDDLDPGLSHSDVERHGLSGPLGTTGVAVNHFRIPPGEGLPGGLHAHADQEELFYVVAGEATLERLGRSGPGRTGEGVTLNAGEAVRFAPGEFQSGWNDSEEPLVVLAMGAPRDSENVRLPVDCPECGHGGMCMDVSERIELVCPDCGIERVPAPCPGCGEDDLRVTLHERAVGEDDGDEARTVVVCSGCGATFDDPPFRA